MLLWASWSCLLHSLAVRCKRGHLEGLVSDKDIPIQGEAEFSSLEKVVVCLWVFAVCKYFIIGKALKRR